MKSDSELMNELARQSDFLRVLSEEESAQMKLALLNIYKDFAALCDKYNLTYMMSGGTCLGAVRHKGFIPWDDDLDVMMPREDYERFIQLANNGELGDCYTIDYPNKINDAKTIFLKIYKNNTLNVEVFDDNNPLSKGLYIDIFALDYVPRNSITRGIKGFIANALQFISIIVRHAQFPSDNFKKFAALDTVLKRRRRVKMIFGRLFSIIPHKYWIYWFDQFVRSKDQNSLMGIPTGRKYYNGEVFERTVFLPPVKAVFEGESVYIPANSDLYLKNLYKDYMSLPPVDKRERHFIVEFKVD